MHSKFGPFQLRKETGWTSSNVSMRLHTESTKMLTGMASCFIGSYLFC